MAATYRVVRGDTLSEIAQKYKSQYGTTETEKTDTYAYLDRLLILNPDITNKNLIYVGQTIVLSGTAAKKTKSTAQRAVVNAFGLLATDSSNVKIYATWAWTKSNTDHYEIMWKYGARTTTGSVVKLVASESQTDLKEAVYSVSDPDYTEYVDFYVKPVSKTYKSGNKDVSYWTADWSKVKRHNMRDNPPLTPAQSNISTSIKDNTLTVTVKEANRLNADSLQIRILRHDDTVFRTASVKIGSSSSVKYNCTVPAGGEYKVRCRSSKNGHYSDWSDPTDSVFSSPPATEGIYELYALSESSVNIEWYAVENAETYEIQHTNNIRYFDANPSEVQSTTVDAAVNYAIITGIASGEERFFRVRATSENSTEPGPWSDIRSVVLGKKPAPPTTWSSATTIKENEPLTLYWVHNSVDGSSQTYAQLELTIGGETTTQTIQNSVEEEEKDKTSYYSIDTSQFTEGTTIQWRVRTAGVLTDDNGNHIYSDWSVQRDIDVYTTPTLLLNVTNSEDALFVDLESLPIKITATASGGNQRPIGYHLSVIANETYETVDNIGNEITVNENTTIYSKYFDTSDNPVNIELGAGDLSFANNISYTIRCIAAMDSGLTAEETYGPFTVAWKDEDAYWPIASIGYDNETYTTIIRPYCEDENEQLIENVKLSVYRREFDGSFTEIATGLDNTEETYVTDPHPALDFARYRIVSTREDTGETAYYDAPGYPIGEKAVIMQWDEVWTKFDIVNEAELDEPTWSGSLLRLPYNIDVSDKYSPDVSFVKYIGRDNPVSYHGTQVGHTSTWSVEIDKNDVDTLYALRRLARWMGNVYVREPSGSGYWAKVVVSYNQKHRELTIPVTFDITRVEGGA